MSTPYISYNTYSFTVYFVCRIRAKNLSRRKNIYKLMILTLLNYVARSYVTANACNFPVLKFNNKGYLDSTYTGQAWSSKRLFAHIPCRLSPRGHKLPICVSVMRVCLHVANLMIFTMLLCAHRQVRLCSVHKSPPLF